MTPTCVIRTSYPVRLRYFEYRKREHGGFAVDETLSQSRYPPFPAHYFWEARAAPIISVEPRILSYRPATRRPSQLVAGENVVNLPRDRTSKTPNQRRK